jgi:hypothetical protein
VRIDRDHHRTRRHCTATGTVKMSRLRQVIAQRMTDSLRVSALLTSLQRVDVTRIAQLRAKGERELRASQCGQALLPAVLREGHHRGMEGVPAAQRVDRPRVQ